MELFLKRKDAEAIGDYSPDTGSFIVKAGSRVSADISLSRTFRGSDSVEKYRSLYVNNGIVSCDVVFKSASTAANFVTGKSTNGLVVWKDIHGTTLKELLKDLNS